MKDLISIIIPIYNVEKYIERCAASLFNQTYESLEYIFVNDCSNDNSIAVLNAIILKYPKRAQFIKIINHAINQGSSTARNTGLKHAQGNYLAFADTDDWMDNDALKSMYDNIVQNNADITWTDFYASDLNGNKVIKQNIIPDSTHCVKALLAQKMHGALWNKLYKRSLFEDNEIRFPDKFDMWEDLTVNIKLFYFAQKVSYLPKAFYYYVQHEKLNKGPAYIHTIVKQMIHNSKDVIHFFKTQDTCIFDLEINYLKLSCKQNLLLSSNQADFILWRNIFPESNPYILSFKRLSLPLRLVAWSASKNIMFLVNIWIKLKKVKNKI